MFILGQSGEAIVNTQSVRNIRIKKADGLYYVVVCEGYGRGYSETALGAYDDKNTALEELKRIFDAAKNGNSTCEMSIFMH